MTRQLSAALILLAAVLLLGFALELTGTPLFDVWIERAASAERVHSAFWLAVTHFGAGWVRPLIGMAAAALLWFRQRRPEALILLSMAAVQTGANSVLKSMFGRVRPNLFAHLDRVGDLSYPSGHAAQNACLYLLIALLIDRRLLWAAVPIVTLIGASRVILGVHWPSDVLGGWMEGAAFALLGAHIAKRKLAMRAEA